MVLISRACQTCSRCSTAAVDASAASFQPSKAAIATGERSTGRPSNSVMPDSLRAPRLHHPAAGHALRPPARGDQHDERHQTKYPEKAARDCRKCEVKADGRTIHGSRGRDRITGNRRGGGHDVDASHVADELEAVILTEEQILARVGVLAGELHHDLAG